MAPRVDETVYPYFARVELFHTRHDWGRHRSYYSGTRRLLPK